MKTFIHLRQYSNYSLLESSFRIKEIINLCIEQCMPAIALTDKQNLFGAFEFSLEAQKKGIQPILGINLELKKLDNLELPSNILLLIKNYEGYKNVINLMSKHFSNDENNLINFNDLQMNNEGIICLSGGAEGPIGKSLLFKNIATAQEILMNLNTIYKDNFFIELTRSGLDDEKKTENFFLSSANKFNIPIEPSKYFKFRNESPA